MKAPLPSVGPESMADDEHVIAAGYHRWELLVLGAIPIIVAFFAETKWVVAAGFAIVLIWAYQTEGRLYDLCIRARRTNLLLKNLNSNDDD
jgi:hypothetical protein